MSQQRDTISEPCAVCGTYYEFGSDQTYCSTCLTELISALYITPMDGLHEIEVQLERQRELLQVSVFRAILASVQGDIQKVKESTLYKNIQKVTDQITLDNWTSKFLSDESNFYKQNTFFSEVLPKVNRFIFLDGTTNYLVLGVATINFGWLHIEFVEKTEWTMIFPSLKNVDDSFYEFRLAGSFTKEIYQSEESVIARLGEHIVGQLNKWNINSKDLSLFNFRGLFGWRHLDLIQSALRWSAVSYTEHVYDARKYQSVVEFIKDFGYKYLKPKYTLSMVGAYVDKDGSVQLTSLDVSTQGKTWVQMETEKKSIDIQSKNISSDTLLIPFVWRTNTQLSECIPFRCYKVQIPSMNTDTVLVKIGSKGLIDLSLASHHDVEVVDIDYNKMMEETPVKLHALNAQLDIVVIVDTLATEKDMQERTNYIIDFINNINESLKLIPLPASGSDLRINIIAYGDEDGAESAFKADNKGGTWPQTIRESGWETRENIIGFLNKLTPTPVSYCHYEASMEDALKTAAKLKWKKTARKILLTFGARPPHDLHRNTNVLYSKDSPSTVDWRVELAQLKQLDVQSYAVLCKDNYWAVEDFPKKEFWEALGYDLLIHKDKINSLEDLSERVLGYSENREEYSNLILPVILNS